MERYQQLVSNSGRIAAHKVPGGLELRYTVTPCHIDMHHMQIDSLFGGLMTVLKRCSTRSIAPGHTALSAPDKRLGPSYAALLAFPVTLGARNVRVTYDDQTLDQPFKVPTLPCMH